MTARSRRKSLEALLVRASPKILKMPLHSEDVRASLLMRRAEGLDFTESLTHLRQAAIAYPQAPIMSATFDC